MKVFIVVKSSYWSRHIFSIDAAFETRKDAKAYADGKNKRAIYLRYRIIAKEMK